MFQKRKRKKNRKELPKLTNLTVPEINLICIYLGDSRIQTISNILDGIPEMYDPDMILLAEQTVDKLMKLCDKEFDERDFEAEFAE